MKVLNNFRKILRTAALWLGLPLLALGCLLSLPLGQIGVVGVADRFGISPLFVFNALNILLIGLFAGFLIFVKRQSESPGFIHRLHQAFPRVGFPNFDFRPSLFDETYSATETTAASHLAGEPVCKILLIHYQTAAPNCAAENSNFNSQETKKTFQFAGDEKNICQI